MTIVGTVSSYLPETLIVPLPTAAASVTKSRERILLHSVTLKANEILDSPLPARRASDKRSDNNNKVQPEEI
jgi:hypothetical protein